MTHSINVPLARRVLAQITAAPQRWTQDIWLHRPYDLAEQSAADTVDNCQTSGCFAGWTVVLSDYKTRGAMDIVDVDDATRHVICETYCCDDDESASITVRTVAAARLGLTARQAVLLFDSLNTLRNLYQHLAGFTEGEITVPDDLPGWADLEAVGVADYFTPYDDDA